MKFDVTGVAVGNTALTATAAGHTTDNAAVNVRQNQILLPPNVVVAPGADVQFTVTLSDPAPVGGLNVSLSTLNPNTGTVAPSTLLIPEGTTSASATATGKSTDKTNNISASAANFSGTSTVLDVETITASFGNPNNTATGNVVPLGATWVTRTVVLSDAAPAGGATFALSFSNQNGVASTTPGSVTVPGGQLTSQPFTINGLQQTSSSFTLTAASTGITSAAVTLSVGPAPAISSLNSNQTLTVAKGMHVDSVSVVLNTAAPPGGLTVGFATPDGTLVTTPAPLVINAGLSSGSFSVGGIGLTATAPATITASASTGNVVWQTQALHVNVVTPILRLFDSNFNPIQTSRTVGSSAEPILGEFCVTTNNCSATLTNPQTISFNITNDTTGGETVTPASVQVPANANATNSFLIQPPANPTLSSPKQAGSYTVSATSGGFATDPPSVTATVIGPTIVGLNCGFANCSTPLTVAKGMQTANVSIILDTPAPAQQTPLGTGLEITFRTSNSDQVGAPAPLLIGAGRTSGTFTVAGTVLTTPGSPVTITASATDNNGVVWKSATLQVNVVQPVLRLFDSNFNPVQATRTVGGPVENLLVQVCVTLNDCSDTLSNPQTITFGINKDTTGGETVTPTSAQIPAGAFETSQIVSPPGQPAFAITLSSPKATGSYTVSATSDDFATDPPSVTTTVIGPTIIGVNCGFANCSTPLTVAKGMQTANVSIILDTPAPSQQTPLGTGLEITFQSSNGDQVGAPAPLLIAAGRTSGTFPVAGTLLTTPGSPVTITASATDNNGVVWKSATLQVNVVQPVLRLFDSNFNPVQKTRTVGGLAENLLAQVCVTVNDCSDTLTNPQTITFSISNDSTGGETVTPTSAQIPAGAFETSQIVSPPGQPAFAITLSSPKATGSYTVNATSGGFATDPQPVTATVILPSIVGLNCGFANCSTALTVAAGMQNNNVAIFLDTPAPAGGLKVNLASTAGTVANVDPSVVIPANTTAFVFTVRGSAPGTSQITASATGWNSPQNLNVTVVTPVVRLFDTSFNPVQTSRTVGGPVENLLAQICVTSNDCSDVLTNPQTITFTISNDSTGGETVTPTSAQIPAGAFATNQIVSPPGLPPFAITLSSPKQAGNYALTATTNGFATDPPAVNVTVK